MTTATTPPQLTPSGHPSLLVKEPSARARALKDGVSTVVLTFAMAVAMVPLVLIVWQVAIRGASAVNWDFFTQPEPPWRRPGGGYVAGFFGTAYIMSLAIALAVPLGIAAAVYLVEYGRSRLATAIRFFTDVMTGVPSIFVGLFVYGLLVVGWGSWRFGTLVGAVAIAVMMLPIVVRSAEEMLKLVPNELRAGSYALGARKWQTVLETVLPAAGPGLTTGSLLAVARGDGAAAAHCARLAEARHDLPGRGPGRADPADLPRGESALRPRHPAGLGRRALPARDRACVHRDRPLAWVAHRQASGVSGQPFLCVDALLAAAYRPSSTDSTRMPIR
jgi:phosphate transport system permease protein